MTQGSTNLGGIHPRFLSLADTGKGGHKFYSSTTCSSTHTRYGVLCIGKEEATTISHQYKEGQDSIREPSKSSSSTRAIEAD